MQPCRLVDNNNLSGPLPPEFAEVPALKILYVPKFSCVGFVFTPLIVRIKLLILIIEAYNCF